MTMSKNNINNTNSTSATVHSFPSCSGDRDELVDTLTAMYRQEQRHYGCFDYLSSTAITSATATMDPNSIVTVECRDKMVEWCYQVTSYCNFDRETVEIALSCLDRFLSSSSSSSSSKSDTNKNNNNGNRVNEAALYNKTIFQLASMTALYTAVKIHEPTIMDLNMLTTLGAGKYTAHQLQAMERILLVTLSWHVNPPSILSFVRHYLQLLLLNVTSTTTRSTGHQDSTSSLVALLYKTCVQQSEYAVSHYEFVPLAAAHVGLMAVLNALRHHHAVATIDNREAFRQTIYQIMGIDVDCLDEQWIHVQNYLYRYAILNQTSTTSSSTASSSCTLAPDTSAEKQQDHQPKQKVAAKATTLVECPHSDNKKGDGDNDDESSPRAITSTGSVFCNNRRRLFRRLVSSSTS